MLSLIFSLLFAVQAVSAIGDDLNDPRAVEQRDFGTVQNDVVTINNDILKLTTTVNNWDGTTSGWVPIAQLLQTIDKDINKTVTDIGSTPPVTAAQAQSMINYINNTLHPNHAKAVTALINRRAQFIADGLKDVTCNQLKRILADLNRLCPLFVGLVPAAYKSAAQAACEKLKGDVQRAIDSFCT